MIIALTLALLAQPDLTGPHPTNAATGVSVTLGAGTVNVDLYWPTDAGRFPAIAFGHGFARNAAVNAGWGEHLASYGFVVAIPNFPSPLSPNHTLNGQILRELMTWMHGSPAAIGASVDPVRGAYVGHSAGGLASFLAAAADPNITALVGLDPVDANSLGAQAAPSIVAPTLVLGAEPQSCNANGSASALYGALSVSARWYLRVVGSTHCDAEDPSNGLCSLGCGGQDAARRLFFRRYATAHLLRVFSCQAGTYLPGGTDLMADLTAQSVGGLLGTGPGACGATDAGVLDAATPPDAGNAPDAAAPPPDAGPALDAQSPVDAADAMADPDAGTAADALPLLDASADEDALVLDAGTSADAAALDSGGADDAGVQADAALGRADAGGGTADRGGGCGCATSGGSGGLGWAALLALAGVTRWGVAPRVTSGRRRRSA
ncbi:MAG: hypothetical protein U1E65_28685 [Myxococcota bacterium]